MTIDNVNKYVNSAKSGVKLHGFYLTLTKRFARMTSNQSIPRPKDFLDDIFLYDVVILYIVFTVLSYICTLMVHTKLQNR